MTWLKDNTGQIQPEMHSSKKKKEHSFHLWNGNFSNIRVGEFTFWVLYFSFFYGESRGAINKSGTCASDSWNRWEISLPSRLIRHDDDDIHKKISPILLLSLPLLYLFLPEGRQRKKELERDLSVSWKVALFNRARVLTTHRLRPSVGWIDSALLPSPFHNTIFFTTADMTYEDTHSRLNLYLFISSIRLKNSSPFFLELTYKSRKFIGTVVLGFVLLSLTSRSRTRCFLKYHDRLLSVLDRCPCTWQFHNSSKPDLDSSCTW